MKNILGGALVGAAFAAYVFFGMTRNDTPANAAPAHFVQTAQNSNNF